MSSYFSFPQYGDKHLFPNAGNAFGDYDYIVLQNQYSTVYTVYDQFGNAVVSNNTPDFGALMNSFFKKLNRLDTKKVGYRIVVGRGNFSYSTTMTYSNFTTNNAFQGFKILGMGRNNTLFQPTTSGLTFCTVDNQSNIIEWRDFKIHNAGTALTGTGFNIATTSSPGELHWWNVECRDLSTAAITAQLNNSYNSMSGCQWINGAVSMTQDQALGYTKVVDCEFVSQSVNPLWTFTSNAVPSYLTMSNCWFQYGTLVLAPGSGKAMIASIGNCNFAGPSGAGNNIVQLSNIGGTIADNAFSMSGCTFDTPSGVAGHWFNIGNNWTNVNITGNTVSQNGAAVTGVYSTTGLSSVLVKNNVGYNPINKITNPFNTATIGNGGTAATATASTNYTVDCGGDIWITAADSANSNNSITVTDGAGNAWIASTHTLTNQYIPWGYIINWGNFTGAAGAVTVWGM